MSPLISIVMPNYNSGKFLKKCISSIIDQTYKNWELLIVDNSSDDNSEEIINLFNDTRINILKIKNEGVIARSRNMGMQKSIGQWIAFIDSDDWWQKTKLEVVVKYIMKNSKLDVVIHNEYKILEGKNKKHTLKYGPYEKNFFEKLLIYGNRLSVSATVVRKKFINEKNIIFSEKKEHITAEDYDFWLKIAYNEGIFLFIKDILGNYFIHKNNYSVKLDLHFHNIFNVCFSHSKISKNKNHHSFILSRKYFLLSMQFLFKKKMFLYFFKGIKTSPFFIFLLITNKLKSKFRKMLF